MRATVLLRQHKATDKENIENLYSHYQIVYKYLTYAYLFELHTYKLYLYMYMCTCMYVCTYENILINL